MFDVAEIFRNAYVTTSNMSNAASSFAGYRMFKDADFLLGENLCKENPTDVTILAPSKLTPSQVATVRQVNPFQVHLDPILKSFQQKRHQVEYR